MAAAADELIPGLLPSFAPSAAFVPMNDTAAGQLARWSAGLVGRRLGEREPAYRARHETVR